MLLTCRFEDQIYDENRRYIWFCWVTGPIAATLDGVATDYLDSTFCLRHLGISKNLSSNIPSHPGSSKFLSTDFGSTHLVSIFVDSLHLAHPLVASAQIGGVIGRRPLRCHRSVAYFLVCLPEAGRRTRRRTRRCTKRRVSEYEHQAKWRRSHRGQS